jgi:hypothetical protein
MQKLEKKEKRLSDENKIQTNGMQNKREPYFSVLLIFIYVSMFYSIGTAILTPLVCEALRFKKFDEHSSLAKRMRYAARRSAGCNAAPIILAAYYILR